MTEYQEVTDSIEIPSHSGIEGFILALRGVLKLPRVTSLSIDVNGKLTYTRYVRPEEPRKTVEMDFDTVAPSALVRNALIEEVRDVTGAGAAVCVARMFLAATSDHMYPVGFVTGANSEFYDWHHATTGVRLGRDVFYGLPVYADRFIPDDALILATSYARGGSLIDVQKSYKVAVPSKHLPLLLPQVVETPRGEYQAEDLVAAGVPDDSDVKGIT